jgi:CHASE2 domain-containing sensor protein/tRNA A-37 threonylcarbamoyl transferase component Bud32
MGGVGVSRCEDLIMQGKKDLIHNMKLKSICINPAVIYSTLATVVLIAVQRLGILEPIETRIYDQMVRLRPDPGLDSRILVVGVTEADLQKLQELQKTLNLSGQPLSGTSLSGEVLEMLLAKLQQYQPRVIGLDIYRDLPVEPGHQKLLQRFQQNDNIITVCKHADSMHSETPAPQGVIPEQVGFSDNVEDNDGIIRRSLLALTPDAAARCNTPFSLGLQVALKYLIADGTQLQTTANKEIKLGNTVFAKLKSDSGGYNNVDDQGYQILLNYRRVEAAQLVSVSDILTDKINPSLITNRVILIGSTAPSLKDLVNTPYSALGGDDYKMPGVMVHAQSVSEILSAVLDRRPLFWFWSEWGEVAWLWGWSILGGFLAWRINHSLRLGIAGIVAFGSLLGSNFIIFTQAGWVPIVSPVLGLALAATGVVVQSRFQQQQEQEKIASQVKNQEEYIEQLQFLLKKQETETVIQKDTNFEILPGSLVNNRYKITQVLASGGFGQTYLAEDGQRPGNPICVVKLLKPLRQNTEFLNIARRLFKTEGEILELLGQHEQIPQLLAFFEIDGQFYLVQEFIKGVPLDKEIIYGKRFSELQVSNLLKDLLNVLAFVHQHRVIHRDIKPANIIRREHDTPEGSGYHHRSLVLIDFGAVKVISDEETRTIAIGTGAYTAPEQILGRPRLNSDIYSVGMVAIQALTGQPVNQLHRDSNTDILDWRQFAEITDEFAAVLDKMVMYDYKKRYQSVAEVSQSLELVG